MDGAGEREGDEGAIQSDQAKSERRARERGRCNWKRVGVYGSLVALQREIWPDRKEGRKDLMVTTGTATHARTALKRGKVMRITEPHSSCQLHDRWVACLPLQLLEKRRTRNHYVVVLL